MYKIRFFENGKEIVKEFAIKETAIAFARTSQHMCQLQDDKGKNVSGVLYGKADESGEIIPRCCFSCHRC